MSFWPRTDLCQNLVHSCLWDCPFTVVLRIPFTSPFYLALVFPESTPSSSLLSCFPVLSVYILAKNGCMLDVSFNIFRVSKCSITAPNILFIPWLFIDSWWTLFIEFFETSPVLFPSFQYWLEECKLFWIPRSPVFWNFMMTCLGESLFYPLGWELSGLFWCGNFVLPFYETFYESIEIFCILLFYLSPFLKLLLGRCWMFWSVV